MTDEETLKQLTGPEQDDLIVMGFALRPVPVSWVLSLVQDSRYLRELLSLIPKCERYDQERGHVCNRLATKEESGGMCEDFDRLYWCDECAEKSDRGGDIPDTDWASVLRRMGVSGT